MIAYIKGNVLHTDDNVVILETGGIGYEITCSANAAFKLTGAKEGAVYTYLAVREDGVSLYGFESLAEKQMFLKLISVSGVGPKMGMTVLSGMHLNELAFAIASSDVKTLSKVKGLGKKTAERIILELRESLADVPDASSAESVLTPVRLDGDGDNAVLALITLGYGKGEATKVVKTVVDEGVTGLENIIAESLRRFM